MHTAGVLPNLGALTRRFTISSASGGTGRKEIGGRMAEEGGELKGQGFMMFEKGRTRIQMIFLSRGSAVGLL